MNGMKAIVILVVTFLLVSDCVAARAGNPVKPKQENKQLLKGEIGSTARFSGGVKNSSFGYEYIAKAGKSIITRVIAGSQAALSGLQAGDAIIDQQSSGGSLSVTVERSGKQYKAKLKAVDYSVSATGMTAQSDSSTLEGQLSIISQHNVSVIIDKSGSMATRDCPGGISRWEWCARQACQLSEATATSLKEGITIVLFSCDFTVFPDATAQQIQVIFQNSEPDGLTNTGDALQSQIDSYFQRKALFGKVKPAIIAVVTDGEPSRPEQVRHAIIDATHRMTDASELSITFLQVGSSQWGTNLLHELDCDLVNEGARYDIVDTKRFSELQSLGLIGALSQAVTAAKTPLPASASVAARRVAPAPQRQFIRTVNNRRVVRLPPRSDPPTASAPPTLPQQVRKVEQERQELERKLLEY